MSKEFRAAIAAPSSGPQDETQLSTTVERASFDPARPLREGDDYVVENGMFVLTREYLLRRGSCCGSGCRNCPYGEVP